MIVSATAPETAITAPTERSMPRVAITIVMPERDQHERCAVAQDVDQRAVELAVADRDLDELRAATSVLSTTRVEQGGDGPEQPMLHDTRHAALPSLSLAM